MSTLRATAEGRESWSWGGRGLEHLAAWPVEARALIEGLRAEITRLRQERDQLQTALESRIVIEQAKGVLAERFGLSPDQAFDSLRSSARSSRRKLRELAAEVVGSEGTPPELIDLRRVG